MRTRLVRKWKVKSAAWAGIAAGVIAGPLAYGLIASSHDPGSSPPRVRVVAQGAPNSAAPEADPVRLNPMDSAAEIDKLVRQARSGADLRSRSGAVAALGRIDKPEALRALVALAQERQAGRDPNFVSLAALSALWARGERGVVRKLAEASPDPAVKSKALALARMAAK